MENLTVNQNTTEKPEISTSFWQSKEGEYIRDVSYNSALVFTGSSVMIFNTLMILLYIFRPKIRKHISYMLLQTFIFCIMHGCVTAIVFPLHRALRYEMSPSICILGDFLIAYMGDYLLLLLPLLAIERLIMVMNPFIKRKMMKRFCVISTIIALILPIFMSWLPLIPGTGIPSQQQELHENPIVREKRRRFYYYFNCQDKLVKFNKMYPIMTLVLQISCFLIVSCCYLRMFCIARRQHEQFSTQFTREKAKRVRRAALSTFVIAITFFFFTWPYGLVELIRDLQNTGYIKITSDDDFWWQTGLALRFTFDCVERLGYFIAPLLFVLFNRKLRRALREFVSSRCKRKNKKKIAVSTTSQSREMAQLNSASAIDKTSRSTTDE